MFCNQCEQTVQGIACTKTGVCGKTHNTAAIQDLLVYALRGMAVAALAAAQKEDLDSAIGRLCVKGLFTTITNVNFDNGPLITLLRQIVAMRNELMKKAGLGARLPIFDFIPADSEELLFTKADQAATVALADDADCNSLAQTLLFGLKGVAAYTDHAAILGYESPELYTDIFKALVFGFDGTKPSLEEWVDAALECGRTNMHCHGAFGCGSHRNLWAS